MSQEVEQRLSLRVPGGQLRQDRSVQADWLLKVPGEQGILPQVAFDPSQPKPCELES